MIRGIFRIGLVFLFGFMVSVAVAQSENTNNQIEVETVLRGIDLGQIFNGIDDSDEGKKVLDSLSGVFVLNSLALATMDNFDEIDSKIKFQQSQGANKIWFSPAVKSVNLKNPNQTLGSFENFSFGGSIGADMWENGGMFLGAHSKEIKQDKNHGYMKDIELGIYGATKRNGGVNFSGVASFGLENFDLNRSVEIGDNFYSPKSKFNTVSARFRGESELSLGIINPFIGIKGAIVNFQDIKEYNGRDANLFIEGGNYSRVAGLAGLNLRKIGSVSFVSKIYGGYFSDINTQNAKINFDGNNNVMRINNDDKSDYFVGADVFVGFDVKGLTLIFGANTQMANRQVEYGARVGFLFAFGLKDHGDLITMSDEDYEIDKLSQIKGVENVSEISEKALLYSFDEGKTFDKESTDLNPEVRANLVSVAQIAKGKQIVFSWTNPSEDEELKKTRMKNVVLELIKFGVPAGKVVFIGK
jgi:hypothetical protein